MAALTEDQIVEYWENPQNRAFLSQAALDNEHQLFHAMLSTDKEDSGTYLPTFLSKVQKILNNDEKYAKFENALSFPLPSHNLISKAADEWNKVFKAQDRVVEYNFTDDAINDEFEEFLLNISFLQTIEQNLFTNVKQRVNTVAIVDAPYISEPDDNLVTKVGVLTDPFIYFVDMGDCHDIQVDEQGVVIYVMFVRHNANDTKDLIVIDGLNYTIAHIVDEKIVGLEVNPHNLMYCPATVIWGDIIDPKAPIRRFNTVLEILADLDKYVIASVFKEHVDLYASFPIVWRYIDGCDLDGDEKGNEDPAKDYVGPGHMIEMTVPAGENAKMGLPVGFVSAERAMLDYNVEKVRTLEVKITKHLTGVDNEIQNEKAFNESQIRSQYETRHSVLRYWAENMQAVHQFLLDTVARLRYGNAKIDKAGFFIESTIDYGMDYFLYDTITATHEYQQVKEAGLPMYIRAEKRRVVDQILTRNSPNAKSRIEILRVLEPYLDIDLSEIKDLEDPMYVLKANFQYYIDKFERENINIIKFGSKTTFSEKINTINDILYEYVSQDIAKSNQRKDAAAKRLAEQSASQVLDKQ